MRLNTTVLALLVIVIGAVSCRKTFNEFLEKAPGVDITENTVFTSQRNTESYVSTMYQFGMASIFGIRDVAILSSPTGSAPFIQGTLSGATDESENEVSFSYTQLWNSGSITQGGIIGQEDIKYHGRWKAIRIANILLERVDEVPDADASYKNQVKGEAYFFRALNHFETFKRYGGIPLVSKRFVTLDEAKISRSTLAETVAFIVKDCDAAIAALPITYPSVQKGRATKLAAMALKSRVLLYAASPLFNTATPYIAMSNTANNNLICYGNTDVNRWKLAADAARAVLDEAANAGVSLIDVPENRDPLVSNLQVGNYRVAWEKQDNSEVIIADKTYPASGRFSWPWYHIYPTAFGSFWTSNCPTHNFVSKYEKKSDGLPQTWNAAGGDDLLTKYNQLDPRFKQSIGYVTSRFNAEHPIIETFTGGRHDINNRTGTFMTKHIPEALANGGSAVPGIALYRLNEFYLNYAEALNEAVGPTADAYEAVNTIRRRSAMPDLPAGLSQSEFRNRVRNERAIEMAFDDHRFWDIRRWLIAEQDGVMRGDIFGLRITRLSPTSYRYLPVKIETRVFNKNMYLHPFELNEILKGNLVQNPGWE